MSLQGCPQMIEGLGAPSEHWVSVWSANSNDVIGYAYPMNNKEFLITIWTDANLYDIFKASNTGDLDHLSPNYPLVYPQNMWKTFVS